MITLTYNKKRSLSVLLVLSMVFTMWMTVSPLNRADAGILKAVGNITKSIFVNAGALAAGALTAVVGAAVGGGPLGMAVGGIAGFYVAKKTLNWVTSSFANVATVAGAIGGGLLCAGMGFPMLAVGILGGGLISRLLVKGVGALISKVTNGVSLMIGKGDVDSEAALEESEANAKYFAVEKTDNSKRNMTINPNVVYDNYVEAYERYIACTEKGDIEGAKVALEMYQTNLEIYRQLKSAE